MYIFASSQFIPDQDNDGTEDLLVAKGGNYLAKAHKSEGRVVGNLLEISSKSSKLLARAAMPDGKETYMSAILADIEGKGRLDVLSLVPVARLRNLA